MDVNSLPKTVTWQRRGCKCKCLNVNVNVLNLLPKFILITLFHTTYSVSGELGHSPRHPHRGSASGPGWGTSVQTRLRLCLSLRTSFTDEPLRLRYITGEQKHSNYHASVNNNLCLKCSNFRKKSNKNKRIRENFRTDRTFCFVAQLSRCRHFRLGLQPM